MGKTARQFTEEFKPDVVRMMRGRGSPAVAEVADDLGIDGVARIGTAFIP
jgi:transposase-like protein